MSASSGSVLRAASVALSSPSPSGSGSPSVYARYNKKIAPHAPRVVVAQHQQIVAVVSLEVPRDDARAAAARAAAARRRGARDRSTSPTFHWRSRRGDRRRRSRRAAGCRLRAKVTFRRGRRARGGELAAGRVSASAPAPCWEAELGASGGGAISSTRGAPPSTHCTRTRTPSFRTKISSAAFPGRGAGGSP